MMHSSTLWILKDFQYPPGTYAVAVGFFVFYLVWTMIANLTFDRITISLSRFFEFQADQYAVENTYGALLIDALKTLCRQNKADYTPDWLYSWWHHTHPTLPERIGQLERLMNIEGAKINRQLGLNPETEKQS